MRIRSILRRLPILALVGLGFLVWFAYGDALSFQALADNHHRLIALRDAHYLWVSLGFVLLYVAVVATSLPGALILTLTSGFLFGLFPGAVYNLIGATGGAVLVFLAARAGFGRDVAARVAARGGRAGQILAALKDNAWSVLLTMRLIPVIPFFLANLLPAFAGIGLPVFAVTTAIGILPGNIIYTALGEGLGEILARGEVPDLATLAQPGLSLPLLGLAALAALPLAFRLLGWRRAGE